MAIIEVNGNIFKYYTRKKDGKVLLSANPEHTFTSRASGCREEVLNGIYSPLSEGFKNDKGDRYQLKFKSHVRRGGRDYYGQSCIKFILTSVNDTKLITTVEGIERLKNYMNLFGGLLEVCMFHDKDDKIRKGKGQGHHNKFDIRDNTVYYSVLSNKWLVSEPVASLFLGFIRDAFHMCIVYGKVHNDEILKKIGVKELNRVINECDHKKAISIFTNQLIPYLKTIIKYPDESYFVILDEAVLGITKGWFKNLKQSYNPDRGGEYWDDSTYDYDESFGYGIWEYVHG